MIYHNRDSTNLTKEFIITYSIVIDEVNGSYVAQVSSHENLLDAWNVVVGWYSQYDFTKDPLSITYQVQGPNALNIPRIYTFASIPDMFNHGKVLVNEDQPMKRK